MNSFFDQVNEVSRGGVNFPPDEDWHREPIEVTPTVAVDARTEWPPRGPVTQGHTQAAAVRTPAPTAIPIDRGEVSSKGKITFPSNIPWARILVAARPLLAVGWPTGISTSIAVRMGMGWAMGPVSVALAVSMGLVTAYVLHKRGTVGLPFLAFSVASIIVALTAFLWSWPLAVVAYAILSWGMNGRGGETYWAAINAAVVINLALQVIV